MNWWGEQRTGYFLFSIDTELAWGVFGKFDPNAFSAERERETVNRLLGILDEFKIAATWAVVGGMFEEKYEGSPLVDVARWLEQYPASYEMVRHNSPLLYGPDIVETLLARRDQHEIAFHGFTHRLFDEQTMSEQEARLEIETWLSVAQRWGVVPRSVTFPRSRVGFLDLFREHGFLCYRDDNLLSGAYARPVIRKVFRRWPHSLYALTAVPLQEASLSPSGLICLPSSFELFGFNRRVERVLDRAGLHNLRLQTLVRSIRQAGAQRKMVHMYAHPYDFRTPFDFERLRFVLRHVAAEVQRGTLRSVTMADLVEAIRPAGASGRAVPGE